MPFDLNDPITDRFRLMPVQKDALRRLGINTIRDLLYHFPVRYGDTAEARGIGSLAHGDVAVIYGKITKLEMSKGFKSKIPMASGTVEDESGKINCVWFNQPYIAKMIGNDSLVRIEGKVSQRRIKPARQGGSPDLTRLAETKGDSPLPEGRATGALYFSNPKIETVDKLPTGVGDSLFGNDGKAHNLYPVYPESRGITSSWLYHSMQKIFKSGILNAIVDPIPEDILNKYNLPGIKTALIWMHAPMDQKDALSARKRFSFEEIFIIQLGKQQTRREYESHPSLKIETNISHVHEFIRRFPFKSTNAQIKSVEAILTDMKSGHAMSRLLEGDVGSGKTAVAAASAYAVIASKLQVAYMCPTEILAIQHFESFIKYFSYMPVQIGLITSSGCRKFPSKVNPKGWTDISRTQLLKWVANNEIAVLIGTHSIIQKSVKFKKLAYAIIDEQHRFGTAQRAALIKKNSETTKEERVHSLEARTVLSEARTAASKKESSPLLFPAPHLLSMTATPIPRTLH